MTENQKTGLWGEIFAVRHLRDEGYEILDANYRLGHLEADIIARDGETLCLVEVKTRSGDAMLDPAENVGAEKIRNLEIIGSTMKKIFPECKEIRYDIIEVFYHNRQDYQVHHIKNAF